MMYDDIIEKKRKIAVVGLGYVGLSLAAAFSKKADVIGFDINKNKISLYKEGKDPTNEIGEERLKELNIVFTSDEIKLKEADFFIIAVPTPVYNDKTPDLEFVKSASEIVGKNLKKGDFVVYESTVYPGVTEEICIPILEKASKMCCGEDFSVGYSPERVNPGDKIHTMDNITKIISAIDKYSLDIIKKVYELAINKTYAVSSIKTAEAIKIAENSQRDINIAFMNELAMVFDKMNIDTNEVVDGMNTKWNALGFRPGLVGGHCISVDPYYFVYQAERLGYHSQIILAGRKVNDNMGMFVADNAVKQMILSGLAPQKAKVSILGITFKENCPDIRNTRVTDIIQRLKEYGIFPIVTDPIADKNEVKKYVGIKLSPLEKIYDSDCVIAAVAHDFYKNLEIKNLFKSNHKGILIDVKGIYRDIKKEKSIDYWCL